MHTKYYINTLIGLSMMITSCTTHSLNIKNTNQSISHNETLTDKELWDIFRHAVIQNKQLSSLQKSHILDTAFQHADIVIWKSTQFDYLVFSDQQTKLSLLFRFNIQDKQGIILFGKAGNNTLKRLLLALPKNISNEIHEEPYAAWVRNIQDSFIFADTNNEYIYIENEGHGAILGTFQKEQKSAHLLVRESPGDPIDTTILILDGDLHT